MRSKKETLEEILRVLESKDNPDIIIATIKLKPILWYDHLINLLENRIHNQIKDEPIVKELKRFDPIIVRYVLNLIKN